MIVKMKDLTGFRNIKTIFKIELFNGEFYEINVADIKKTCFVNDDKEMELKYCPKNDDEKDGFCQCKYANRR